MLIWTEERKRVKQMERESLAWAVACAVAQTGPRVQPPAVVQRSANPRPAAAALPPGRFRAASPGPRGGAAGAGGRPQPLLPAPALLETLTPRASIFSRIRAQSRLLGRLGRGCGVRYMPTLPWRINRRCPSDTRCDSPFIQLQRQSTSWKTQLVSKPLAFCT